MIQFKDFVPKMIAAPRLFKPGRCVSERLVCPETEAVPRRTEDRCGSPAAVLCVRGPSGVPGGVLLVGMADLQNCGLIKGASPDL